jgi:hypothetical protein
VTPVGLLEINNYLTFVPYINYFDEVVIFQGRALSTYVYSYLF